MNTPVVPPLFDWTLIRSFIAVMDTASLQAAARKLRSSQPTIGRHIALLERQLGSMLFERTGRQLIPTPLAFSIAEHARSMETSANAIALALAAGNQATQGTVRISASQISASYLLPPILKKLREKEPGIAIELVASQQLSDLVRREADIAIRLVEPDQPSLIARRMGAIPIGIYAHKDYLAGRTIPQSLPELLDHQLIGFDHNGNIICGFKILGVDIDRNAFSVRTDDHIALLHAIKAGLGIGFTAVYVGRRESDLVRLLPELPIPPLQMWLVVHQEVRSNPRIRLVFDFLAEAISQALQPA